MRFGGKREELAADYMAVWMMTEGGYKAEGGLNFLRTVQRRLWWNISLNHPSFGRRIKTVAGAITSAANSPTWARAHPELATAATGGDPLAGARACSEAGAAPCATSAALSRTGDRVSVALGKLDIPQEIAPETLSPQPGQAAPPAILRTVPGVALDVPAPGPVQRSEPPEAVSAIHADAKMATGGLRLSEAPVAEQPESNGAPSPTQIVGAAERSVLPRLAPAATLMFEPNPLQPNHLGATAAMPDQLLVAGSAFAASHSSLPPDRGVAGGHGSGSRECAIPVAQGGAGIAAWY